MPTPKRPAAAPTGTPEPQGFMPAEEAHAPLSGLLASSPEAAAAAGASAPVAVPPAAAEPVAQPAAAPRTAPVRRPNQSASSAAPIPVQPAPVLPIAAVGRGAIPAGTGTPGAAGQYTTAGQISARQVMDGDPNRWAHLDDKIVMLVNIIQQELVKDEAGADNIVAARYDADLKAELTTEIDRLALRTLMAEGRSGAGENPVIVAHVVNEILGLGPLEPLWADPSITEVIVNGPTEVYVEMSGKLQRARGVRFRSQEHLLEMCQRILSPLNRKLDVKDPLADGRLPDGSRVNAVHIAVAPKGPLLTIRRFPAVNRSLVDLVEIGAMTEEMACTLSWLVASKASSLVVGGTGTGKTTLLNALSAAIPRHERVVTIEDSLELRLHPESHVAAMEGRPADASGKNAITIRDLVKNALRMRPDRIVVGEVRGAEALNMLEACNTGHEGSMSTVHANGPNEALARLAVMIAQGGEMPADKVDWLVGSALDLIIQIRRYKDGSRRISGIYEVPAVEAGQSVALVTSPLWEWVRDGENAKGKLLGHYEKRNEISEHMREKLGLDFEPMHTWDYVKTSCGRPAAPAPATAE